MQPLVSISCFSYNHEAFLEECLDGFIMQNTDFKFEVLIHDDASTDKSGEIIRSRAKNNTDVIKPLIQSENLFPKIGQEILKFNFNRAKGKYIAMCEGDDYWTDPQKLNKQVAFLEAHPEYSLCFHSVGILTEDGRLTPEVPAENRDYAIEELLLTKVAHTASFVFRKEIIDTPQFRELMDDKRIFAGDIALALYLAEQGKVYGMSDNMAVYRVHSGGISVREAKRLGVKHYINFIRQYKYFKKSFKTLSRRAINNKIGDSALTVSGLYRRKKDPRFILYFLMTLYYNPGLIKYVLLK